MPDMAGGLGFEPRLTESESAVLPLNYPPTRAARQGWREAAALVGAPPDGGAERLVSRSVPGGAKRDVFRASRAAFQASIDRVVREVVRAARHRFNRSDPLTISRIGRPRRAILLPVV